MDLSVQGNVFGLDDSLEPTRRDLDERLEDPQILSGVRDTGGRLVLTIFNCLKPVIAAINGAAVGVGATMTLPMDVRLAAAGARIGFVFNRIGIVVESCSSWFLPRLVGISRALEWCYEAAPVDVEEARQAGLIRSVVSPDQLMDEARKLAHRFIDGKSQAAVAMTRQLLWKGVGIEHPLEAHKLESLAVFDLQRKDGREGIQAFREKRAPNFKSTASRDLPPFAYEWLGKEPPKR
jgi:enoyl-CoA hydratase/carnithine racemase